MLKYVIKFLTKNIQIIVSSIYSFTYNITVFELKLHKFVYGSLSIMEHPSIYRTLFSTFSIITLTIIVVWCLDVSIVAA